MIKKYKGVWICAEQRESEIVDSTYELIHWGKELSDKLHEKLSVVLLGYNLKNKIDYLFEKGADKVYYIDHPKLKYFNPEIYPRIIEKLIGEEKPEIFIASATTTGRTLMPIIASHLKTGLTADCTSLEIDEETGLLLQIRPAIGGNVMATIKTPDSKPQMATVRPKSKRPLKRVPKKTGEIILPTYPEELFTSNVERIGFKKDPVSMTPLQEADIVISGGKGMKGEKGFKLLSELSDLLNGTIGASRAAVDMGWISYPHQVGLSGKTVNPKLYMAIGISGAIQHMAGMSSSEVIIAINKDPEANIFKVCDFGIEGDLFEILPILISKIKNLRGKNEK